MSALKEKLSTNNENLPNIFNVENQKKKRARSWEREKVEIHNFYLRINYIVTNTVSKVS